MKNCVECRFFRFETYEGNGCPTCGYEGSVYVGCAKLHWSAGGLGIGQTDFYGGVRKAEHCADYDALTVAEIEAM